jgi:hypothetical protein
VTTPASAADVTPMLRGGYRAECRCGWWEDYLPESRPNETREDADKRAARLADRAVRVHERTAHPIPPEPSPLAGQMKQPGPTRRPRTEVADARLHRCAFCASWCYGNVPCTTCHPANERNAR